MAEIKMTVWSVAAFRETLIRKDRIVSRNGEIYRELKPTSGGILAYMTAHTAQASARGDEGHRAFDADAVCRTLSPETCTDQ